MKLIKFNNKKLQAGLTMIELLIGIVALAALVFAILTGYQKYKVNASVKDHVEDLVDIATGVENAFKVVDRDYSNVTAANAISAKVIPDNLVSAGAAYNPWGGLLSLAPATITNANDAFTIESASVPEEACQRMAEKLINVFNVVEVGGVIIKDQANGVAPSSTAIQANCASPTANLVVTYQ